MRHIWGILQREPFPTGYEREFVARTEWRFGHARMRRADKGVVLRFVDRVSG